MSETARVASPAASKWVAAIGECMVEVAVALDGQQAQLGFGGDTLNSAVYLARSAGPHYRVSYLTALGIDPFSDAMCLRWEREGLDISLVARFDDRLPGLYVINTDAEGERTFFYWRQQAAARAMLSEGRAPALARALDGVDLIYLTGITVAILAPEDRERLLELLDECVTRGAQIAFDTNYRPRLWGSRAEAREAITNVARRASIVMPSAMDDRLLFGDVDGRAGAARWLALGATAVVVKDGPRPCWVATGDHFEQVHPEPATNVVDTTAAGDSFNGAFLAARLSGDSLVVAARKGHILARQVIGHRGALTPLGV